MVSFWPFGRGNDDSPDSFERALSKLAAQIQETSTKLAILQQRSRRYKALVTLYSVFGYILYLVLVAIIVGYQNLGPKEGGVLVSGPLGIYSSRKLLDAYYSRRIAHAEDTLQALQAQQKETIEKLKAVTKFSTTQSLIEKYGGTATDSRSQEKEGHKQSSQSAGPTNHQSMPVKAAPPKQNPGALTPEEIQQKIVQGKLSAQRNTGSPPQNEESLPAFPRKPDPHQLPHPPIQHLQPEEASAPRWYDRLLDVIIGEDETSAKNRYALICKNCRMVNGLAPPGTSDLLEVGEWGCARCGAPNGKPKAQTQNVPQASIECGSPKNLDDWEGDAREPFNDIDDRRARDGNRVSSADTAGSNR